MKKALSAMFVCLLSASAFAEMPVVRADRFEGEREAFRSVICEARNLRTGREFEGIARDREIAAREAIRKCERFSERAGRCEIIRCRFEGDRR
jgi:hypothetical protein